LPGPPGHVAPGIVAVAALAALVALGAPRANAQRRLADESDRQAFRAWFVYLADARFYVPAADVTDCAALVRHAWREALRAHTPEWRRQSGLPALPAFPDVAHPPAAAGGHWPLFRVSDDPDAPYREFADAQTLVRFNARRVSRDWRAARPGDLLFYHQDGQREPDHLMVMVGASPFDPAAQDFVVYHTGPDDRGPGEMRKVRLADLRHHPAARWRPVPDNHAFVGVFRPAPL
jgi:uncharacterized protein YfaT (DUF1175 family)